LARPRADEAARIAGEVQRRKKQLETMQDAFERLRVAQRSAEEKAERCEALDDHLSGFYEEIDKLSKGKILVGVTDLVVAQANDIVRDAKALIEGDTYLDRVKEFVPAGDNSVYPDVLLTARAVQQSVGRFQSHLQNWKQDLALRLQQVQTIILALQHFVENDGYVASKADVATHVDTPSDVWFSGSYGDKHFDFARLDNRDVAEWLLAGLTAADGH
jgi:hypothetical protein